MGDLNVTPTFPNSAVSRGYDYGGYHHLSPYAFLPFLDPVIILAAFAFVAYLIQTFHTLYLAYQTPAATIPTNSGLLGTVVEGLVPSRPTRNRDVLDNDERVRDILAAIHAYRETDSQSPKEEKLTAKKSEDDSVLVPVATNINIKRDR